MAEQSSVEMSSFVSSRESQDKPLEFETEDEFDEATSLAAKPPTTCASILMVLFILFIILFGAYFIYTVYNDTQRFSIIILNNESEIAKTASEIIANLIRQKPNASLGLIAGLSISEGIYQELINKYKNNEISFKDVSTYNIGEYAGLNKDNKGSLYNFIDEHFLQHVDINKYKCYFPKIENDIAKGTKDYENLLKNKNIDLQLLGVGTNGHIGFNEPGTSFDSNVHVVNLSDRVIKHFSKLFGGDVNNVPKLGVTMGIKNILNSDTVVLYASGKRKAEAIRALVRRRIDINVPVTALSNHKGKVYIIIDKEAASLL